MPLKANDGVDEEELFWVLIRISVECSTWKIFLSFDNRIFPNDLRRFLMEKLKIPHNENNPYFD